MVTPHTLPPGAAGCRWRGRARDADEHGVVAARRRIGNEEEEEEEETAVNSHGSNGRRLRKECTNGRGTASRGVGGRREKGEERRRRRNVMAVVVMVLRWNE